MTFKEIFKDCRIAAIFDKPSIIAIAGDVNSGKSMLIYHILGELKKTSDFKIYFYGLKIGIENAQQIFSVAELEKIRDSFIVIDEFGSLFDLDNRKIKKQIENTLRLIHHNNNILLLSGTPESYKKFLSAKISRIFFKSCTILDFINGSSLKYRLISYQGDERGSEMLNLKIDESLVFDGEHFCKINLNYYPQYDSKRENVPIIVPKIVQKNIPKDLNTDKFFESLENNALQEQHTLKVG